MKALLIDYDGTLALVDEDEFAEAYFFSLNVFMVEQYRIALDHFEILDCVAQITRCADGTTNNYDRFLKCLSNKFERFDWKSVFESFYASEEFDGLRELVRPNDKALELFKRAKESGLVVVLATNPIFPKSATEKRLEVDRPQFVGLQPCDVHGELSLL